MKKNEKKIVRHFFSSSLLHTLFDKKKNKKKKKKSHPGVLKTGREYGFLSPPPFLTLSPPLILGPGPVAELKKIKET